MKGARKWRQWRVKWKSHVPLSAKVTGQEVSMEFEAIGLMRALPEPSFGGLVQGLYGLNDQAPDVVLMADMRFGLYTALDSGGPVPTTRRRGESRYRNPVGKRTIRRSRGGLRSRKLLCR